MQHEDSRVAACAQVFTTFCCKKYSKALAHADDYKATLLPAQPSDEADGIRARYTLVHRQHEQTQQHVRNALVHTNDDIEVDCNETINTGVFIYLRVRFFFAFQSQPKQR